VACSTIDLSARAADGSFSADLYRRLSASRVVVPPLRERREDIPLLAEFFLERFVREGSRAVRGFAPTATARLAAYRWPGNVRELALVVQRACLLAADLVQDGDIALGDGGAAVPTPIESELGFHDAVEDFKRRLLAATVARAGGNQAEAARRLGLQRTYLYRLMKTLGLREPERPEAN
jgi:DNA-binding NtrC family response regulator